jgi:hypothetical protein
MLLGEAREARQLGAGGGGGGRGELALLHQPVGEVLKNDGVTYYGVGLIDGVGISGDFDQWDLNHVMYVGESITHDGIKISLIRGGDNDTVRIEKA